MSVVTARAVLLRSHPYSESSLVLRFFSDAFGTVAVLARGVRKGRSGGASGLDTFTGGDLTLYMKEGRELQTMKDFVADTPRRALARHPLRFGGASVLGELVLRHGGEAAAPALLAALEDGLDRLDRAAEAEVVPTLLGTAWRLIDALGYRPFLEGCVSCGRPHGPDDVGRFDLDAGGVLCPSCSSGRAGPRLGPGARTQLGALLSGETPVMVRPRAHLRLLNDFAIHHVTGGRPLETMPFVVSLLPEEVDGT